MAFVSQSERKMDYVKHTASGELGPGNYLQTTNVVQDTIQQIYPKKQAPFNQTGKREVNDKQPANKFQLNRPGKIVSYNLQHIYNKLNSFYLGPGQYKIKGEFDKVKYIKEMDQNGTFLMMDNGHINQRI